MMANWNALGMPNNAELLSDQNRIKMAPGEGQARMLAKLRLLAKRIQAGIGGIGSVGAGGDVRREVLSQLPLEGEEILRLDVCSNRCACRTSQQPRLPSD